MEDFHWKRWWSKSTKIRNLPYQPFNAWRLAPTLLFYHPGTKYIRKQKCHTLQSTNIQKIIFSLKSPEKHNHSTSAGKKSYCSKTWPRYNKIHFLKSKFHKCFVLLFIWMCFIYFYTMALSTNNVFPVILVDILVTYKALHGLNGLIFYCTPQHLLRLSSSNLMSIPMTKTTLSVITPRLCNDLPNAINPCLSIDYLKSRDCFYGGGGYDFYAKDRRIHWDLDVTSPSVCPERQRSSVPRFSLWLNCRAYNGCIGQWICYSCDQLSQISPICCTSFHWEAAGRKALILPSGL